MPLASPSACVVIKGVPQGTTAGQQISFVHTDGRNVSLILPDGVVPGQTLHVNVPDAPPEPGKSAAPPSQSLKAVKFRPQNK